MGDKLILIILIISYLHVKSLNKIRIVSIQPLMKLVKSNANKKRFFVFLKSLLRNINTCKLMLRDELVAKISITANPK
jgi:hypothetical protein